jgi:hypothetical protein
LLAPALAKPIAAPSSTAARTPLILLTLTRPRHTKTIKTSPLRFCNRKFKNRKTVRKELRGWKPRPFRLSPASAYGGSCQAALSAASLLP